MAEDKVKQYLAKKGKQEVKPVEDWNPQDWEIAYNILQAKYEALRIAMRKALNNLSSAI